MKRSKLMKAASLALALTLCVGVFTACGSSSSKTETKLSGEVTASGSSALQPLAQQAAEDFMKANPDVTVSVNGGGSGTGLKQVADGSVDIGNSDVAAEEKLDKDQAAKLTDNKVAVMVVAPVVNKDLGVDNLTTQQLTDIFTGKITNWKQVNGPDLKIMLVTRPASSGTRATFKKYAIGGAEESSKSALENDDSGTLMETVQKNKGAIAYVALSYLVNADKAVAVKIDGVEPSLDNAYSGKYKVWSYEHMYVQKDKDNAARDAFIKYVAGDDNAANIEKLGYGVISKMTKEAEATHK